MGFLQTHLRTCLETNAVNPLEKKLETAACGEQRLGMTLEFNGQALFVRSYEFVTEPTPCTCVCILRTQVRIQPILRSHNEHVDTLQIRGNPVSTRGPDTMLGSSWEARAL